MLDLARLFSRVRFGETAPRDEPHRDAFQRDQDRITFARPFRRLQAKTQVHPLPHDSHVRNRLVHTLEVASVGRSLGVRAGALIEDRLDAAGVSPQEFGAVVRSACMIHDIGNPTFGHAGEDALATRLARLSAGLADAPADLAHFDGNAQGFRIVTKIDMHRMARGFRLTYATLGAMLKYPWGAKDARSRDGTKFCVFDTERDAIANVVRHLYGIDDPAAAPRHPATWLMEAADDIAYTLADLEDAVDLGIVPAREVIEIIEPIAGRPGGGVASLRGLAIGRLIDAAAAIFATRFGEIMSGVPYRGGGLLDDLAAQDRAIAAAFGEAQRVNRTRVYVHDRKVGFELAADEIIGTVLDLTFAAALEFDAVRDAETLSRRHRQALTIFGDYRPEPGWPRHEILRSAVDAVAGMTDPYATFVAARLRGLELPL
ncbi:dGTP triphosphohydrolase [Elioraea sp.]|uniref:dGTP triphosphohydrolase n=1 Tax=Elioraea sp. TaxID=2185103 RepID=UPI003F7034E8